MLHNDGLWTIVDEENSKAPPPPVSNNDIFKFGNQVIRIQIYNPADLTATNKNFLSLYQHLFPEYDFTQDTGFDFVKKFAEPNMAPPPDASVRGSAVSLGGNTPVCRICLDIDKPSRPFAREICNCSDSMPVHGDCLLDWIKMKCKPVKSKSYVYYDLAHLACDVCKEQYPPFLPINGVKKPILKLDLHKSSPFALLEIYKIDGIQVKHLVILDMSSKAEERYTIGSSQQCTIQFKSELIKDFHTNLITKGDKLFIFNLDKKLGTLRKVQGRVPLDNLHMKVLISGKFSFLFHVFMKGPCNCIKKGLKTIKGDPTDNDERLVEEDFVDVKKDLRSFAKKGSQRQNDQVPTQANITSEADLDRRPPGNVVSSVERSRSSRRPQSGPQQFASEMPRKPQDDNPKAPGATANPRTSTTPQQPVLGRLTKKITEREFEEIQARKSKRMTQGKRIDNDFNPTFVDGQSPLPKPSIGTSELYFMSDVNFRFD